MTLIDFCPLFCSFADSTIRCQYRFFRCFYGVPNLLFSFSLLCYDLFEASSPFHQQGQQRYVPERQPSYRIPIHDINLAFFSSFSGQSTRFPPTEPPSRTLSRLVGSRPLLSASLAFAPFERAFVREVFCCNQILLEELQKFFGRQASQRSPLLLAPAKFCLCFLLSTQDLSDLTFILAVRPFPYILTLEFFHLLSEVVFDFA